MEDDSLDSLITNNPAATSASVPQNDAGNNVSDAVPAFRPKLRKIKRPKIRPMSDIPAAPAKIMPQAARLSENTVGNISVSPAAGYTGTEFPASGTNGAPHLPTETETKIPPTQMQKSRQKVLQTTLRQGKTQRRQTLSHAAKFPAYWRTTCMKNLNKARKLLRPLMPKI